MSADIAYRTFSFDIYHSHIEVDVWRVRHTGGISTKTHLQAPGRHKDLQNKAS